MTVAPIATEDHFTFTQGLTSTMVTGNLGADNGGGMDFDPDGTVLGWVGGTVTSLAGDGDRFLGAFFTDGSLRFLSITGTVSYPFPIITTWTTTMSAEGGRVTLDTSGTFTYQSVLGFSGNDSFTYTLVDADFNFTTTTVQMQVAATPGANDRPTAATDTFQIAEDTVLAGSLIADNGYGTDFDADGDVLLVQAQTITSQAGGMVRLFADGSFTYTARANYHGADGFDYILLDPAGAQDIGHVSLTVLAVNDLPEAMADHFTLSHDHGIVGNLLAANGTGPDRDADGEVLVVLAASLTTAAGGQVAILADGSFTYRPVSGYLGADSFDYSLVDASGASGTGHVTLDILNQAPVAETDTFHLDYQTSIAGNLLGDNGLGADSDPDGDALTLVAARFVTELGSVLTVRADGGFSFTAGDLSYGLEVLSYQAVDALGIMTTGNVQIYVSGHDGFQGSYRGDVWTGSARSDIAMLAGGDDKADGLGGRDVIGGGSGDETIFGGLGNDRLYGEADKDDLFGGFGADRLEGGMGHDRLKGGGGADQFVLSGGQDSDRIVDFTAVDRLVFRAEGLGLDADAVFDASWLVASGAADGDHGRFVYETRTRSLSWDDDGLAGTADLQLVTFDTKVTLTLDNFLWL